MLDWVLSQRYRVLKVSPLLQALHFREAYQRKLESHQRKSEAYQRKLEFHDEFEALRTSKEGNLFFRTLAFGIQKLGTEETFTLNDRTQQLTRYFKQIRAVIHPIIPLCEKGQWKARDPIVESRASVQNLNMAGKMPALQCQIPIAYP